MITGFGGKGASETDNFIWEAMPSTKDRREATEGSTPRATHLTDTLESLDCTNSD